MKSCSSLANRVSSPVWCSFALASVLTLFDYHCILAQSSSSWTSVFDTPRSLARNGNEAYTNKRFKEAEEQYRLSLDKDRNLTAGSFNLGAALYKQGRYDDAASQFRALAENGNSAKDVRAQAYHNLGNSLLKSQKLPDCVDAYKNALRINPADDDTRHNLAYAKQLLAEQQKKEQQKQQQNNQNQDEQKQQDQQQQNQDKNQDKNQQNQQPNQPPQNNQPPQQGQSQPKLSKADAERILEALNNEERNVQKKLIKRKASGVVIEKDW